jgi:hypothetical protein
LKKAGTPVFFVVCAGSFFFENNVPMLPAWSWGLHKSQSSGRKRSEHFVGTKRKGEVEKVYKWCVFLDCERLFL